MDELKNYLQRHGAAVRLADRSGLAPAVISKYRSGRLAMSLRSAILIEKATDGELRAETLLAHPQDIEAIDYLRGKA